jgi:hypothetical protein
MAEINAAILQEDGYFDKPLSDREQLYLTPSILTAWAFIGAVQASGGGMTTKGLEVALGINVNTVRVYGRWLRDHNLVDCEVAVGTQGSQLVYKPKGAL